jgi:hypothetical protein
LIFFIIYSKFFLIIQHKFVSDLKQETGERAKTEPNMLQHGDALAFTQGGLHVGWIHTAPAINHCRGIALKILQKFLLAKNRKNL